MAASNTGMASAYLLCMARIRPWFTRYQVFDASASTAAWALVSAAPKKAWCAWASARLMRASTYEASSARASSYFWAAVW